MYPLHELDRVSWSELCPQVRENECRMFAVV